MSTYNIGGGYTQKREYSADALKARPKPVMGKRHPEAYLAQAHRRKSRDASHAMMAAAELAAKVAAKPQHVVEAEAKAERDRNRWAEVKAYLKSQQSFRSQRLDRFDTLARKAHNGELKKHLEESVQEAHVPFLGRRNSAVSYASYVKAAKKYGDDTPVNFHAERLIQESSHLLDSDVDHKAVKPNFKLKKNQTRTHNTLT